jgi:hypothetical protein
MIVQIESAVPHIKYMLGDCDEARKIATGHSCESLGNSLKNETLRTIN